MKFKINKKYLMDYSIYWVELVDALLGIFTFGYWHWYTGKSLWFDYVSWLIKQEFKLKKKNSY